ncbi:hypothetical protein AB8Z38_11575 [Bradyrhizobium sp. LLZ17]|uniref:Uncharacterized protein n=1 Tax=Bradyrhizobium sp. LLZ17 TaxID=3239388 RepID=A0AB39XPV7_9BRAD
MGSEENYERMWQMRRENEQRLQELQQQRREREYLEAMSQPVEDRVERWKREAEEQTAREQRTVRERRRSERRAEPAPVNWDLRIADAIAEERRFLIEVVGQAVGELREQIETSMRKEFEEQLRQTQVDAAEAKIMLGELRISFAELREQLSGADQGKTIDLPSLRNRAN